MASLAARATVAGRRRVGQGSSLAASGGSPGLLPEGPFVLWRSCGVPRRLIGDLEQAWCADVQAREGCRIQQQHESLPFLHLHLHLLDLLVDSQHHRPHCRLGRVIQLSLFGHQCAETWSNAGP
jgi:hypothetical protein